MNGIYDATAEKNEKEFREENERRKKSKQEPLKRINKSLLTIHNWNILSLVANLAVDARDFDYLMEKDLKQIYLMTTLKLLREY